MIDARDIDAVYRTYAVNYLTTGDHSAAALAAGVAEDQIGTFLECARSHPAVIQAFAEDTVAVPDFNNKEDVRNHLVKGLWREAKYKGPGSTATARISAFKALAELTGVEPAKQIDVNNITGGIMMVPSVNPTDWEAQSVATQAALKEEVRK